MFEELEISNMKENTLVHFHYKKEKKNNQIKYWVISQP